MSGSGNIYKRVYFHAVRRALLENENVLKRFMEERGKLLSREELLELDAVLTEVGDTDLLNMIMGYKSAEETAKLIAAPNALKYFKEIVDERNENRTFRVANQNR